MGERSFLTLPLTEISEDERMSGSSSGISQPSYPAVPVPRGPSSTANSSASASPRPLCGTDSDASDLRRLDAATAKYTRLVETLGQLGVFLPPHLSDVNASAEVARATVHSGNNNNNYSQSNPHPAFAQNRSSELHSSTSAQLLQVEPQHPFPTPPLDEHLPHHASTTTTRGAGSGSGNPLAQSTKEGMMPTSPKRFPHLESQISFLPPQAQAHAKEGVGASWGGGHHLRGAAEMERSSVASSVRLSPSKRRQLEDLGARLSLPRSRDGGSEAHVFLSGSFDGLNARHRLLLREAALRASEVVTVEVRTKSSTAGNPLKQRLRAVRDFLRQVNPNLRLNVTPAKDKDGPALRDPQITGLVAAEGAESNANAVNRERSKRGLPPLNIHIIPLSSASEKETRKETTRRTDAQLSSGAERRRGPLTSSPAKAGGAPSLPLNIPRDPSMPKRAVPTAPKSPRRPYAGLRPPFETTANVDDYDGMLRRLQRLREEDPGQAQSTPQDPPAAEPATSGTFHQPRSRERHEKKAELSRRSVSAKQRLLSNNNTNNSSQQPSLLPKEQKKLPFLAAGGMESKSHSLPGSIQILLAQLKTSIPPLHQKLLQESRKGADFSLQDFFQRNLDTMVGAAEKKVQAFVEDFERMSDSSPLKKEAFTRLEKEYQELERLWDAQRNVRQVVTSANAPCRWGSEPGSPRLKGVRAETIASRLHRSASASNLSNSRPANSRQDSARRRIVGINNIRDIRKISNALSPHT